MAGGGGVSSYSQSVLSTSSTLAWLYVSVLGLSYALCTLLLHTVAPVDAGRWATFNAQVPGSVFSWQLAGFGGVLVLNAINLMFCSTPVQYNCNVLLVLIHSVAFATDWLIEAQATPVVVSWGGRMFLPLRYIQWCHTTPTMILLMSMMSDMRAGRIAAAVAGDLLMVATGLAASWTAGAVQLVMLLLSFGGFVVVMHAVVDMFLGAMAESTSDPTARKLLARMLGLTLLVWSLFPLVWLAAYGGLVHTAMEQVLWGVSDYAAKVVFSSHLWQKNLATVQQRREAAQELMGALDRGLLLERVRVLLASKERLVYALSHELRSPINGMLALVQELLHNKTQSSASRTKMLMMLRSSATCLLNTINTTLSSSGPGSGTSQMPRRLHKVHLWRVCEAVLRLTRPMVKEHVKLINCISRDMPPVKADSMRLMQVLMNLVCTSLKFTHAGDVKISASQTHSAAHVVVADTGHGIPPEQLHNALDPFKQVEGSDAPDVWEVCRSGLGLYLVQQALASMGSSIEADSELGRGSTFRFELPLADSECESESEIDTDVFSEAGSLRASLELAEFETAGWRGVMSSESQQSGSIKQELATPSASGTTRYTPFPQASSSNTTASSIASGMELAGQEQAAAAGGPGQQLLTQLCQQQLLSLEQPPAGGAATAGGGRLTTAAAAAAVAAGAGAGAGLGPAPGPSLLPGGRPLHRCVRGGVIQVLSVDDDPVNQLVASTALRSHKWEVVKSMSGTEALEYLERGCSVLPDLVLLDVMMPSMSGFEVAARIREHYPSSMMPIIMVSAKTEEEDIVQGLRCGADDYITKPFKRAELAARIRAHIRARDVIQAQAAAEQAWLLAHNLLPLNVQRKLRNGETVIAESHPGASVLWAEVVGGHGATAAHTAAGAAAAAASGSAASGSATAAGSESGCGGSGGLTPAEAVVTLNSLYTTWEELCGQQDVLGVDFSGSTFVAVSGHDDNPAHLGLILATAEAMLGAAGGMRHADGTPLAVRLGVHTGPLTTGLVGSKAVKLVLMGDTVDVARQLAGSGCPSGIHISQAVYEALPGLGGSSGDAAAAAMPWTLQSLPGSSGRQHTYLLPSGGCWSPRQVAALLQEQQQQQQAQGADAAAGSSPTVHLVDSGSSRQLALAGGEEAAGPAAAAAAAEAGVAVLCDAAGSAPAAVHEVSVGRLARFLRTGAAAGKGSAGPVGAADGADGELLPAATKQAGDDSSTAASLPVSSSQAAPELPSLQTQQQQQPPAAAAVAATCSSTSGTSHLQQHKWEPLCNPSSPAAAPSSARAGRCVSVVSSALPAPAPGGSVGFGARSSSSSRRSSIAMSSRDAWAAAAAAAAVAGSSVAAAGSAGEGDASSDSWLLSADHQQPVSLNSSASQLPTVHDSPQQQPPAAAQAAFAAASSGRSDGQQLRQAPPISSTALHLAAASLPLAHAGQQISAGAEVASLPQQPSSYPPQALAAAGAVLLSELGVERRALQEQLLERSQQYSAAAAELGCVKAQLAEAQSQSASQAAMVAALRQHLGQALLKAHLADCWRALATMKTQINNLALPGQQAAAAAGLLGAPLMPGLLPPPAGAMMSAQQQQQLMAAAAAGGSQTTSGGCAPYGDVPGPVRVAASPDGPSLHQLLAAQTAQLAAMQQQQQLLLLAGLQQGSFSQHQWQQHQPGASSVLGQDSPGAEAGAAVAAGSGAQSNGGGAPTPVQR